MIAGGFPSPNLKLRERVGNLKFSRPIHCPIKVIPTTAPDAPESIKTGGIIDSFLTRCSSPCHFPAVRRLLGTWCDPSTTVVNITVTNRRTFSFYNMRPVGQNSPGHVDSYSESCLGSGAFVSTVSCSPHLLSASSLIECRPPSAPVVARVWSSVKCTDYPFGMRRPSPFLSIASESFGDVRGRAIPPEMTTPAASPTFHNAVLSCCSFLGRDTFWHVAELIGRAFLRRYRAPGRSPCCGGSFWFR